MKTIKQWRSAPLLLLAAGLLPSGIAHAKGPATPATPATPAAGTPATPAASAAPAAEAPKTGEPETA
ncbi:MAG TPA: hypothetical protein VER11_31290, partial [Polyangiaceae bacterium]|nr:hypothetical protein [Polyangiaceae bacterium]